LATNNKDFKIKNGLVVEGATATVNGNDVLTTASDIDDLSNVNTAGVADGNALVYDETTSSWIAGEGGGAGGSYTISETPPSEPSEGDVWFDSITGNTYIYYSDYDNDQWIQTAGPNIIPNRGAELYIGTTAPGSPVSGDMWYDSSEGFTYIYYEDVDSEQWVQFGLNRNGSPGTNGTSGTNGTNGTNGQGVPVGGTTEQILTKNSSTNYDTGWSSDLSVNEITATGAVSAASLASSGNISFTTTGTANLATGATVSGSTKTVNLGTAGASGSNSLVTVGSQTSGSNNRLVLSGLIMENTTIAASAATGTVNLDSYTNKNATYYTSNATGNWTLNVRGNASATFNSLTDVGSTTTVVFMVTTGTTPFYQTGFQIDGVSQTIKWLNGTAPTSGIASSIEVYSFTIIKTATEPTYTVFGSKTRYA
jgi:hypothetical protein